MVQCKGIWIDKYISKTGYTYLEIKAHTYK